VLTYLEKKVRKYNFINFDNLRLKEYFLVPLRKSDTQLVRHWRNDQIRVLRQKKRLTKQEQLSYFNNVVKKSFEKKKPDLILCSLMLEKTCVGYGGLVHINWNSKRAEVSFLNETRRSESKYLYKKDFTVFFELIKKLAFKQLNFKRIDTETYDIRPFVIKLLEKNGFKRKGKLKKRVFINGKFVDSIIHSCLNT